MIYTTDGKIYVYGVFEADGCECEFLSSLHEDKESAQKELARRIKSDVIYGDPKYAKVKCLEVQK